MHLDIRGAKDFYEILAVVVSLGFDQLFDVVVELLFGDGRSQPEDLKEYIQMIHAKSFPKRSYFLHVNIKFLFMLFQQRQVGSNNPEVGFGCEEIMETLFDAGEDLVFVVVLGDGGEEFVFDDNHRGFVGFVPGDQGLDVFGGVLGGEDWVKGWVRMEEIIF